ncbi:MAG: zinc ribbon domain-containing protein [Chloroflexaceae bacterium]|nr:zinc ribbon domain-containing protein [Chloroflexaceae bacterium]NJL33414.1 zinc ribbon domain-containing protein [Chloroflexaceae bacterium]NJO06333.1 zinc ribbon domain-containing protein [Chloroflexaceae bacterium]
MPMYEYQCEQCNTRFELLRPLSQADADAVCVACSNQHVRRALSLFATFARTDTSASTIPVSGGGCCGGACGCSRN